MPGEAQRRTDPAAYSGSWWQAANRQLAELDSLPIDASEWQGRQPTEQAHLAARRVISELRQVSEFASIDAPFIAPRADQGVQLEWGTSGGRELEISVTPAGRIEYLKSESERLEEGIVYEYALRSTLRDLMHWLLSPQ